MVSESGEALNKIDAVDFLLKELRVDDSVRDVIERAFPAVNARSQFAKDLYEIFVEAGRKVFLDPTRVTVGAKLVIAPMATFTPSSFVEAPIRIERNGALLTIYIDSNKPLGSMADDLIAKLSKSISDSIGYASDRKPRRMK